MGTLALGRLESPQISPVLASLSRSVSHLESPQISPVLGSLSPISSESIPLPIVAEAKKRLG